MSSNGQESLEVLFDSVKEREVSALSKKTNRAGQIVERAKSIKYVPTGFTDIDVELGGGLPYGLSVAGARPEDGLFDFGLNVALNASYKNHKVAFISPGLPERIIKKRALMREAKINPILIRKYGQSGENFLRAVSAVDRWNDRACINFYGDVKLDTEQFKKACIQLKNERGVDFVVLDRLQSLLPLGSTGIGTTCYSLGREISAVFEELVTEHGLALLVLCEAKKKGSEPISTNHLRDCGALEYGARPIIMLEGRKEYISRGRVQDDPEGRVDVHVANNFEGSLSFDCELIYLKQIGHFDNYIA